jgi:hypothetical protein
VHIQRRRENRRRFAVFEVFPGKQNLHFSAA